MVPSTLPSSPPNRHDTRCENPLGVAGTLCEQHHLGYLRPIRCQLFTRNTKKLNESDVMREKLLEEVFLKIEDS